MKISWYVLLLLFIIVSFSNAKADTIYRNISVIQADSVIQANLSNSDFIILDVRQATPYNIGHISGAINIDFYNSNFSSLIGNLDQNKMYLIYCQSGGRSATTFTLMQTLNFREVYNMLGGMNSWLNAGYPVESVSQLEFNNFETSAVIVSPNPITDVSVLKLKSNKINSGTMEIFNSSGRKIKEIMIHSFSIEINRNDYENGLYFYLIKSSSNLLFEGKFIVK
jgi:rhodanese-related sulfurtransferase